MLKKRTTCTALGLVLAMLVLSSSSQAGQSEPGLFAEYFNDTPTDPGYPGSYDSHFKTIILTQTEAIIDFTYGAASPSPAVRGDYFSARWSGLVIPPETGTYVFQTITDDGVILTIDGGIRFFDLIPGGSRGHATLVSMTAGVPVPIVMEYYEYNGFAEAHLLWTRPSGISEVIPTSALITGPIANDQIVGQPPFLKYEDDPPFPITLTATDALYPMDPVMFPLTFTVLTQPMLGTLSGTPPDLTYTPNPNANGTDTFTFTVTNSYGYVSTPGTVTIILQPVDDGPPTVVDDSAETNEGVPVTIDILANDAIIDIPYTVAIATAPTNGTVTLNANNKAIYTPTPGFFGVDTFTYAVTDQPSPLSQTRTGTVSVTVHIIDPVITSSLAVRAIVNVPWSYTIISIGTKPITYSVSGLPAGLTYANGVISGTITNGGLYTVTLTAQGPLSSDTRILAIYAGYAEPVVAAGPDPYHIESIGNVTLNFAKANNDKISLRGSLPVPGNFASNGQTVFVDFGGVLATGQLDMGGKFVSTDKRVSFKLSSRRSTASGRNAAFNFKYRGSAASQLADEGLINDNVEGQYCTIKAIIQMVEAKLSFESDVTVLYSAKKGVKGSGKGIPGPKPQ